MPRFRLRPPQTNLRMPQFRLRIAAVRASLDAAAAMGQGDRRRDGNKTCSLYFAFNFAKKSWPSLLPSLSGQLRQVPTRHRAKRYEIPR